MEPTDLPATADSADRSRPVSARYSLRRDRIAWLTLLAGGVALIPMGIFFPVVLRAVQTADDDLPLTWFVVGLLGMPMVLLGLWLQWCVRSAWRRIRQMRRLQQVGVELVAEVMLSRVYREKAGIAAVSMDLRYEFEGQSFRTRITTCIPGTAARIRDYGTMPILVDPQRPEAIAVLLQGELG
ncbi:unnamed protein product [Tuwongella immobilis]|uniref:Uncharacterized protein n=2 Tax=Tuwongella immobilis TaxID=692036 RepID=A0A6C2YUV8_9BACT|nr:unnamed protein product [Tuwongella immobilis]VTS07824.1 unnamed protein product [Tuwongella immobilis]